MEKTPVPLAGRRALEYLEGVADRPVRALATSAELRLMLDTPLTAAGEPRRVGHQSPGRRRAARHGGHPGAALLRIRRRRQPAGGTAADWLVSAWDQNSRHLRAVAGRVGRRRDHRAVAARARGSAGVVEHRVRHRLPDGELHVDCRGAAEAARRCRLGRERAGACSARRRFTSSSATNRTTRSSPRCGCSASARSG